MLPNGMYTQRANFLAGAVGKLPLSKFEAYFSFPDTSDFWFSVSIVDWCLLVLLDTKGFGNERDLETAVFLEMRDRGTQACLLNIDIRDIRCAGRKAPLISRGTVRWCEWNLCASQSCLGCD